MEEAHHDRNVERKLRGTGAFQGAMQRMFDHTQDRVLTKNT